MSNVLLEFQVAASQADSGIEIYAEINQNDRQTVKVETDPQTIRIMIPGGDEEGQHVLTIGMRGKLPIHTKVDDQGNITQDVLVSVTQAKLDDIDIGWILQKMAVYEHDGNGSYETKRHPFYGDMGCNGQVKLAFNTPAYLWLLENM